MFPRPASLSDDGTAERIRSCERRPETFSQTVLWRYHQRFAHDRTPILSNPPWTAKSVCCKDSEQEVKIAPGDKKRH
eukprot:2124757-Amphidinium_carterae.1